MFWKKKRVKKKKPSREDIISAAHKAAQAKREEIGEETLDEIRKAIMKRENNPLAKAQKQIKEADLDTVLDNLSIWMKDKDNK